MRCTFNRYTQRQQCTAKRQEYRVRCSGAARGGCQDHSRNEQTEELFEFPHIVDVSNLRPLQPAALKRLNSPA